MKLSKQKVHTRTLYLESEDWDEIDGVPNQSVKHIDSYLSDDVIVVKKDFRFEAHLEAPFNCCGLTEIGGLDKLPKHNKGNQRKFNEIIRVIADEGYPLFITIVDKKDSDSYSWKKYLNNCPEFRMIKEFVNPNSGNKLITYFSK